MGVYSKPEGYYPFNQKIQELKKKYYQAPRKGIQAEKTLQEYLQSKQDVIDAILLTDQALTQRQRQIEVERVKAEAAKNTAKIMEELQQKNDQLLQQKEKSYWERMQQLTEKMEKEQAQMRKEQQMATEHKLQEQARQLYENFRRENRRLQDEIKILYEREASHKCVIS